MDIKQVTRGAQTLVHPSKFQPNNPPQIIKCAPIESNMKYAPISMIWAFSSHPPVPLLIQSLLSSMIILFFVLLCMRIVVEILACMLIIKILFLLLKPLALQDWKTVFLYLLNVILLLFHPLPHLLHLPSTSPMIVH